MRGYHVVMLMSKGGGQHPVLSRFVPFQKSHVQKKCIYEQRDISGTKQDIGGTFFISKLSKSWNFNPESFFMIRGQGGPRSIFTFCSFL